MAECVLCKGLGTIMCYSEGSPEDSFEDCDDCSGTGEVPELYREKQLKQIRYDEQDNPYKKD